jgi:hypothetical protein
MIISIDYDKTWTEDPDLWHDFANVARHRRHSVVMVTGRKGWTDDMARGHIPTWIPIIYAGDQMKEKAARAAGYPVDVWIDDMPGTIQAIAKLDPSETL